MSFTQLALFRKGRKPSHPGGVTIGTVKMREALGLAFTISSEVAQDLGWKTGERIGVAIGEGTDEGLVALFKSPDGLKLFGSNGPGVWGGRFNLSASYLPIPLSGARASEEVAFERKPEGVLLLALPPWAYQTLPPIPMQSFRVVDNRTVNRDRATGAAS